MGAMTVWEGTIATRRTTARLCTVLGVAVLVAALVLALLPGAIASCGSLLAPMFPPSQGVACAASQGTWLPMILGAAVVGLLLLAAGAAMARSRRSRTRR
jgi:ABC-type Na+ efflux pump permease subunit